MNMQQASAMRKNAQAGFTLIELIVVIVILGILSAVALPKFVNLGGDARVASLNAAKGALASSSAMVHGRWLLTPGSTVALEGVTVTVDTQSGYPTVSAATKANFLTAAGLAETDYAALLTSAATANQPAVLDNQMVFIPQSVVGTPKGLTCFVRYTAAVGANTAPVIDAVTTLC